MVNEKKTSDRGKSMSSHKETNVPRSHSKSNVIVILVFCGLFERKQIQKANDKEERRGGASGTEERWDMTPTSNFGIDT